MAGNLYIKFDGLTGECVEGAHKGWIDTNSYSEGLQSSGSSSYGGGAGVGTVSYNDFTFTCQLEKAIPDLMKNCADHKPYSTCILHATKMGGSGSSWTYLEITLSDAVITGVHISGSENQIPTVQVSVNFTKIKSEYWEQTSTGGKGASTNAGWNQKENKSF